MTALLNVDTALDRILAEVQTLNPETVSLAEALDRVVAEDIPSPISLPPFDNSAMDGYAIQHEDSAMASDSAPVKLPVVMDIPAGAAPTDSLQAGQASRIMTGAPIPEGATAVVPIEDTDDSWRKDELGPHPATIGIRRPAVDGQHIRLAGENIAPGATVIKAGSVIRPAEMGMLAGIGAAKLTVLRKPKVLILSSGDELVDVHHDLEPGKIRDTNSYALAGLIRQNGGIPIRLPTAKDTLDSVRALYRRALSINPDLIISTAGVSIGAADLVKVVLDELGDIDFWRVNMRPGKPLAFGSLQGLPFFGLPGNPVSAMVTFEILVKPALAKIAGRPFTQETVTAIAATNMKSDGRRSYNRVVLSREDGSLFAASTGNQSSGALMSMVQSHGLAVIPEDTTTVPAGSELTVILLRPLRECNIPNS